MEDNSVKKAAQPEANEDAAETGKPNAGLSGPAALVICAPEPRIQTSASWLHHQACFRTRRADALSQRESLVMERSNKIVLGVALAIQRITNEISNANSGICTVALNNLGILPKRRHRPGRKRWRQFRFRWPGNKLHDHRQLHERQHYGQQRAKRRLISGQQSKRGSGQ